MCGSCQVDRNGADVLRGVTAVFPNKQPEPLSSISNQTRTGHQKVEVRRKEGGRQRYKTIFI